MLGAVVGFIVAQLGGELRDRLLVTAPPPRGGLALALALAGPGGGGG